MLCRSVRRFTGDYLANQVVMRLGGPGEGLRAASERVDFELSLLTPRLCFSDALG